MRKTALITLLTVVGCQSKQLQIVPQPASKPEIREAVPKKEEVPEKVIAVTGWRNLRWGDASKVVAAKCKGGPLICGWIAKGGKKKGYTTASQNCFLGNGTGGKLAIVDLVYLDDSLQRIVVAYHGLGPDSSEVENLNSLLVERYCLLARGEYGSIADLNSAIKEAKQSNVGQSIQLHSTCRISPGDFFVQIQNDLGSSNAMIFLSSDLYNSYLTKNEFAGQWDDTPAIEHPVDPAPTALSHATTPPPQPPTSQPRIDKKPRSGTSGSHHPDGVYRERDDKGNTWLCRDGIGCELESRGGAPEADPSRAEAQEADPFPVPVPQLPAHPQEQPASTSAPQHGKKKDWNDPFSE